MYHAWNCKWSTMRPRTIPLELYHRGSCGVAASHKHAHPMCTMRMRKQKKNLEKIKGKQMSYCCGVCAWLWCTLPLKNTHFKMKNRLLSICGKHLTSFQCAFKNISHSYASEAQILLFVSRVCLVAAKCNKWRIYKDYGYSVWLKSAFNVHHQQMHLNFLKFKMQWKRKIRKKKRGAMKQNLSD